MHVLCVELQLQMPHVHSLKEKRAALRPVLDRLPKLGVSVSEVGDNDVWKSARLGVAVVSGTPRQASEIIDEAERIVWGRHDIDVVSAERTWMEIDR